MVNELPRIHPGEILLEEFLKPRGEDEERLARETGLPRRLVSDIIAGRREITAHVAACLESHFELSKGFWIALQADYNNDRRHSRESDTPRDKCSRP